MNYEFHVGDYVEDVDGRVGYISEICTCEKCKARGWYEPSIRYTDGTEDYISHYDVDGIPTYYKRIGTYDFTKEEKKKIEHLEDNLPVEGRIKDKTVEFEQYFANGEYIKFVYNGKIIDKINELVDAVNELRDKEDNE